MNTEQDWGETDLGEISKLKELTDAYHAANKFAKELKQKADEATKEKERIGLLLQNYLADEGLERFDSDECFTTLGEETYVTAPADRQSKIALFKWLEERDIFYDYATVNWQSLQSLHKAEKENGRELPGVGEEKTRPKLRIYDKKKKK